MAGRRLLLLSAAPAALLAAFALVRPLVDGRTRPPVSLTASVSRAMAAARGGEAGRWAPEQLPGAEAALGVALAESARQQARLVLLRDFTKAETALWRAAGELGQALRLAIERREEARTAAEETLAQARDLHAHADGLVARTTLPHGERARLQKARLLLGQAALRESNGDFREARREAEESMAELQRALGPALDAARRYTSAEQLAQWQRWAEQTREWSRVTGRHAVLVFKEKNQLVLLSGGRALRTYAADIGANAIGVKRRRGDRATPEGRYRIIKKKDRGQSVYHRALLLDYPNEADRRRIAEEVRAGRVSPGVPLGGLIEIHGEGGRGRNWTDGCVALANGDMDDLYRRVDVGTWVTILGGDGRDGAFSGLVARIDAAGPGGRP